MKTLFLSYDPEVVLRECEEQGIEPIVPHRYLVRELEENGIRIETFTKKELQYFSATHSSNVRMALHKKLKNAGMILHDTLSFRMFAIPALYSEPRPKAKFKCGAKPISDAEPEVSLEMLINSFLYFDFPAMTHGVYTPLPDFMDEEIRHKRYSPAIMSRLDVPYLMDFLADDFDEELFPAMLKHPTSKGGQGVYHVMDKDQLLHFRTFLGTSFNDYIIQLMIETPTEVPVHFRTVCFGDEVLGAMIYYNENARFIDNGVCGGRGISLTSPNLRELTPVEKKILDAYSIPEEGIPFRIGEYSKRIAEYASEHGCQMFAIDFVVSREKVPHCIDVTANPGIGFFHVCFNGNGELPTPREETLAIQGKVNAAAAMKKFFNS